jgi:hypothetical protein
MVSFMKEILGRGRETLLVCITTSMGTFTMGNGKMTREMARAESLLQMVASSAVTFLKIKQMEMSNLRTKMEMCSSLKPLILKLKTKQVTPQNPLKVKSNQMQKAQWLVVPSEETKNSSLAHL